jgi:hypothetical protein
MPGIRIRITDWLAVGVAGVYICARTCGGWTPGIGVIPKERSD